MIKPSRTPGEARADQPGWPRHWFSYLVLLLIMMGSALLVIGASMPAYTDPVAAERIISGLECARGIRNTDENLQCNSELWHRSMNALRTAKWRLIDGGGGLLVSGLMMAVFFWWNAGRRRNYLLTLTRSLWILTLASSCWLMQIPAYQLLFLTEGARGYYPHWADSIAIPIFQIQDVVLRLFWPYMAIWLVLVVGARLSVQFFSTARGRPLVAAFWTVTVASLLVPVGWYLIGAILDGPMLMVPFLWVISWLTLYLRSAALIRHRPGSAQPPQELTRPCRQSAQTHPNSAVMRYQHERASR